MKQETPSEKPTKQSEKPTRVDPSTGKRSWVSLVVIFGAMFGMFFLFIATTLVAVSPGGLDFGKPKIGVVEVIGPIMESKDMVKDLRMFREDPEIVGIVVRIDSPGGAVAPSQEMFQALQLAKKEKPLAVSMGSTAASGGYYIAIGSDQIFANNGTITGSIGVVTQLFDFSQIVELSKVEVTTLKTGIYKDTGSPFRQFTETDRQHLRAMIDDIYDQFVEDVAKARKMDKKDALRFADGRVYTGRQAKENGLIDEIGTFEDVIAWVAKEAKIEGDPVLVYPKKDTNPLADLLAGGVRSFVAEAKTQSTPVVEYRYVGPQ